MKILILNRVDISGGAAKASYRLHRALLEEGLNSSMIVDIKRSNDDTVIGSRSIFHKFIVGMNYILDDLPIIFYKNRNNTYFSTSLFSFNNIIKIINKIKPDIVHLHWISKGFIKIENIAKIKFPIVWTLHDMWPFTGGCHYSEECLEYKNKCGFCPVLKSKKENDLSRLVWNKKSKAFEKIKNITIIGLSKWLNECSKNSTLLKNKRHINLPNPIDTKIFKPINKKKIREIWNLPSDKKLILFGAIKISEDIRKGFKQLTEALQKLNNKKDIELIILGSNRPKKNVDFGFNTHYIGKLDDDVSLANLYNAADLVVVPSLQENLSNTIMESLACGTPVVAFDIGGNSDMIEHKINGYLAKPYDTSDLANGIEWVLNEADYENLSKNAREKILKEFDSKIVVKKYIELYKNILNRR